MPYEQLVQLNDRKNERLGPLFTAEKVVGVAITTLPLYIVSTYWPPIPRLIAIGIGVYLGLRLTRHRDGFSFYEWLVWWLRSQIWERLFQRDLHPEDLEGTVPSNRRDLPLSRESIARIVTRRRSRLPILPPPFAGDVSAPPATPPVEDDRSLSAGAEGERLVHAPEQPVSDQGVESDALVGGNHPILPSSTKPTLLTEQRQEEHDADPAHA